MTMIAALLGRLGVPVLAQVLGDVLARVDSPAAQGAAQALGAFDHAVQAGDVNIAEANRHAEEICRLYIDENKAALGTINATIQAELQSEDKYVRRMRPTFGYVMALTWAAQMMALAYIIVFRTGTAYLVLQAVESLSVIWTVGLSVLGIYVYRRSDEKRGS
jgi:hypothetical protein